MYISLRVAQNNQQGLLYMAVRMKEGKVLFAEVKCVTDGSHICYYEINVTDDLGTEVALVTANGYRMTQ